MKTNNSTHQKLSKREQQVLQLIAHEHSTHQVAEELFVSYETATSHRKNLLRKLQVKNTAGMVRVAFELGLLRVSQIACLILFLCSQDLSAQVTNGNNINYEMDIYKLKWDKVDEAGKEDPTWKFLYQKTAFVPQLNYSSYDDALCFHYDDKAGPHYPTSVGSPSGYKLYTETNKGPDEKIYIGQFSFENDILSHCHHESGLFDNDDWQKHTAGSGRIYNFKHGQKNQFNETTFTSTDATHGDFNTITYRRIWRYNNGNDWANALDFGTINSGTKQHDNSNQKAPVEADSNMGYSNNAGTSYTNGQNSADVHYKFTIVGNAKRVVISTNHSQTNYDTYLHLRWYESNSNNAYIRKNDDANGNTKSEIVEYLCAGTYLVTVEGFGNDDLIDESTGSHGDFRLSVTVADADANAYSSNSTYPNATPGTITAGPAEGCTGDDIGQVNGTAAVHRVYDGGSISYEWQIDTGNGYGPTMTTTTTYLPANLTGQMGTGNALIRRRALACGAYSSWVTDQINLTPSTLNPGSIEFQGDITTVTDNYTFPIVSSNTITGLFKSVQNASGAPSPITMTYEVITPSNGSITVETGADWQPGGPDNDNPFTSAGEYQVRRKATNNCNKTEYSNTIIINVVPNVDLGSISGKVISATGAAPVEGVTVTAERTNNNAVQGAAYTVPSYTATTSNDGTYTITNIYYGSDNNIAQYSIAPSFVVDGTVHSFTPTSIDRNIQASSKSKTNVDFTDNTSLSISGSVSQLFDPGSGPSNCGMDTVAILVGFDVNTAIPVDSTDSQGNYNVSVASPGEYVVMAKYKDHIFAMDYTGVTNAGKIVVNSDITDLDFRSTNMNSITGKLTDGCGDPILNGAEATIRFQDFNNCWVKDVTTVNNGEFSVTLPSREYKIFAINHPDQLVNTFFASAKYVDLSESDTTDYLLKYRAQPVVTISGLPADLGCSGDYEFVPVMEQVGIYPYSIDIKELALDNDSNPNNQPPANTCPVDTGIVKIIDAIGGRGTVDIEFTNGVAEDTIIAGEPNLIAPHLKLLSMTAMDTVQKTLDSEVLEQNALVTGARSTAANFDLITPELPMMILRDPPGDNSYAFVENTETHEVATKWYTLKGGSNNKWGNVKIGTKFEAGFIGFDVETKIWNDQQLDVKHGSRNVTTDEIVNVTTTSSRFQTSNSPLIIGSEGDLVIGAAMVMNYSTADILSVDGCDITLSQDLIVSPKAVKTQFFLRTGFIRDVTIPNLEKKVANPPNPDSLIFYKDQVRIWKHILMYNDSLKAEAVPYVNASDPNGASIPQNLTLSDNASIEYSITATSSQSLVTEFITEIDKNIANSIGAEVAGVGLSGGYLVNFKTEQGKSESTSTTSTFKSGFLLLDDDVGDGFNVSVLSDPVYKTPVFKLNSGQTSCPWEPGTQKRDDPQLLALDPIQTNIPDGATRTFNFEIGNTSETGEDRVYSILFNNGSNSGARIEFQNLVNNDFDVPAGPNGAIDFEVNISQFSNPSDDYTFEGLEFLAVPFCEKEFQRFQRVDNALVSAFYQSPCTDVAMATPMDNWVINSSMTTIPVKINDYTKPGLQEVHVEYSEVGTNNWVNAMVIPAADLLNNVPNGANLGTTVQLDATNIPDGEYYLRLKSICTNGIINYSIRAQGIKDTKAPELLGLALPIDDIYDSDEDLIGAQFDEIVKAKNLSNASLELLRLDNADNDMGAYSASFQLFGNSASIVPANFIANPNLFAPGAYRVVLHDIEDLYGNVAGPLSWVFITPGYEVDDECSVLDITNNNSNQDAISTNNYRAISITSNGKIIGAGETRYLATTEIELQEEFEVEAGGEFLAAILPCEDDICGNVVSSSGQANAPDEFLDWNIEEEGDCVKGIYFGQIIGNVYVYVGSFTDNTKTAVNVEAYLGSNNPITTQLTAAGAIMDLGTYTTLAGNVYDIEIALEYIDGTQDSKIVVATVKMYPQTTF